MVVPSREARESITLSSTQPHLGQRIKADHRVLWFLVFLTPICRAVKRSFVIWPKKCMEKFCLQTGTEIVVAVCSLTVWAAVRVALNPQPNDWEPRENRGRLRHCNGRQPPKDATVQVGPEQQPAGLAWEGGSAACSPKSGYRFGCAHRLR